MCCSQGGEHKPILQTRDRVAGGNHRDQDQRTERDHGIRRSAPRRHARKRKLQRLQSRRLRPPRNTAPQSDLPSPATSSPSGSRCRPRHSTLQRSLSRRRPIEFPANSRLRQIPQPGRHGDDQQVGDPTQRQQLQPQGQSPQDDGQQIKVAQKPDQKLILGRERHRSAR